jgi:hypothetical protein
MQHTKKFKVLVTMLMAVLWAMTVNHCFLESVFALDSNPVHHEGSGSPSHGEPCDSGVALSKASQFSIEQILPLDDLQFSLSAFVTRLLQISTEATVPLVGESRSHSSAIAELHSSLLSAPNAPPFHI